MSLSTRDIVVDLVNACVEGLRSKDTLDLVRISVGAPESTRGLFREVIRKFMRSFEKGALLTVDVSRRGAQHLYGLALLNRGERALLHQFCEHELKASPKAVMIQTVRGWPLFARGDEESLRKNLVNVLAYAIDNRFWPEDYGIRDANEDVAASGLFAEPWRDFLAANKLGMLRPRGDASVPSTKPSRCRLCGVPIAQTKRSDSKFCTSACRKRAHRARKAE